MQGERKRGLRTSSGTKERRSQKEIEAVTSTGEYDTDMIQKYEADTA